MKPFHYSIRTVLLTIIGLLNLMIALPLGYMTYQSVVDYYNAQRIKHISAVISDLYMTKKNLSQERAASLSVMFVPPSSFEAINTEVRESRAEGDAVFAEAIKKMQGQGERSPEVDSVLDRINKSYAGLKILRMKIDAAVQKTGEPLDPALDEKFFVQSTSLIESIDSLIETYSLPVVMFSPDVTRQMRLTHFIWGISEYAGREYAILGQLIAQNKFPDSDTYANLVNWRTRIQFGLELADSSVATSRMSDEIYPYLKEAETHYMIVFEQIKDLFYRPTGASTVNVYPITVEMWLQLASEAVNSLQSMTHAVLDANNGYILKIEDDARRGIFWSLFLLTCAVALSVYTWRLITVRVIAPVNLMVDMLHREALRSNHKIPDLGQKDEISKLTQVLSVFQQNARQLKEERDKAQAATVAKSEFLANMSHEIRTPMNVVVGISSILARSTPLTEKQQEFIKTLQLSAESLLSLLNDLLDFSKIETHNLVLEKIPFNLAQMLEELVMIKSFKAKQRGLVFVADISGIEGKEYVGDPTRIRQILENLCGNAIKFTEHGRVTLKVKGEMQGKPGMETLVISVKDTGIGIKQEKIETIFEKFTQADSTITRKYGGTGLGLAITKNLVDMMNGTISVESIPGEGTTFMVSLPLAVKDQLKMFEMGETGEIAQFKKKKLKKKSKKILLVEDYAPNALVVGAFIEEFGYEYDTASNGQEAIQKFMENNYHIILMDLQMPGMDGFEATTTIRKYEAEHGYSRSKIIGLTAHASTKDRDKCLEVGMDDFLSKPFEPRKLREILRSRRDGDQMNATA